MKIGTLFSGIGSPEQGASRVYDDLDLVFACEWDKYARESFKANYYICDEHFHKDIADMDGKQYKDKVGIIIGGSPCQDFSLAGLRAGIEGNKGVLIYEYIRIIKEVNPPIFIYENVDGMLSDKGGRTIKEFVEAFREMGYYCHYEVLNTKDYGVPHTRKRIFLVGFKCHEHYHNFSFAPKIKLTTRLKDLLEDEVDEKYYLSQKMIEGFIYKETENKLGYINQDTQASTVYKTDGTSANLCAGTHGYAQGYIKVPYADTKGYKVIGPGDTINLSFVKNPNSRGTCRTDGIANTLDIACNQAFMNEDFSFRRYTPRECFRLQDFPDSFKFVVSNSQLYKQAGNSISVNVMEMIFNQIEKSRDGNTNHGSLF